VAAVRAREHAGTLTLDVDVASGHDVRAEIARCVVQKGWDLLGLTQAGMSLEEIFLHLTTSDEPTQLGGTAAAASEEVQA
jgi:ABC-2 type transport system ATP-binding protein